MTMQERAARLAANPHNLPRIDGAPPMGNLDYWRARFEREGRDAGARAANPYRPGTMAATRWQAGRDGVDLD